MIGPAHVVSSSGSSAGSPPVSSGSSGDPLCAPTAIPTAPGRLPLLGHIVSFLRSPTATLQSLRSHGDIVLIHLGRRPVYVVNSPELIHGILVTRADKFARGRFFQKMRPVVGNGIILSEGAFHLRQRRMMQPAFYRERLQAYAGEMRRQVEARMARWRPGRQIAAKQELLELTNAITVKALFRCDLGDRAVAEIRSCLSVLMKGILHRTLSPSELLEKLPTPGNRRWERARVTLQKLIAEIIADYEAESADRADLMSLLMATLDEETGQAMSRQQLHDEVMTLLIGGTETMGASLAWLFHELGRRPDIEWRLRRELDCVLGGRRVTFDDLSALEYTRRVINESLRLHNPIWVLMRRATADVDLCGVRIPRDAELIFSPTTLHRDPALYPHPRRFDPDRWAAAPPRGAYIPFGAGRHKCIGDQFALTAMTVTVATIIARWRLVPAFGRSVREQALSMLHPDQLPMTPQPRSS